MVSHDENAQQYPTEKEMQVDSNFIESMKLLMIKLKLNCKTILAYTWTTLEESSRFKIAPWVSTWDVAEGLRGEARLFFIATILILIVLVTSTQMHFCFLGRVGCRLGL